MSFTSLQQLNDGKSQSFYLYSKILVSVIFDLQGIIVEQVINNMAHFFKKWLFWLFWYLFISSEVLNCTIRYEEAFSLLTFHKAGTFSICEFSSCQDLYSLSCWLPPVWSNQPLLSLPLYKRKILSSHGWWKVTG